jgi:methylenetetrahydrofolate reductase (NADPH)
LTRIGELFGGRPTLSFEFFPPKSDEAERALEKVVADLAELGPSFVSVTYGAGGSTRERTRDVVVHINRDHAFPAMPHLTCVGHTMADVSALLDNYAAAGIENILCLGGDPPADGSDPGGDFAHATDLIEVVRAHPGQFSIGVAAHPEVHPRSPDRASDRRHLADKLAMADFGLTQFFFDVDAYTSMLEELDALGADTPIVPGIMPVINVAGLRRMAGMNGTAVPADLLERLDAVADQPDEVAKIGVDAATEVCAALFEVGVPGIHLYAMNKTDSVRAIHQNLGL